MILCGIDPWVKVRQLWRGVICRVRRHALMAFEPDPRKSKPRPFEKAELIEKYGFNRHL